MKFNIVMHDSLLVNVKTINLFKIDLGRSVLNKKTFNKEFNDDFAESYCSSNNRFIHKCGTIGSIIFYTDILLEKNVLLIFGDDKLYEIEYDGSDMKQFLSKIIQKIEEHNVVSHESLPKLERKRVEMWVANDEKNKNKSYDIDQTLDKEEYLKKMFERRNA